MKYRWTEEDDRMLRAYDPTAQPYSVMGPPEAEWTEVRIPLKFTWDAEDDADISRLIAVCQERDAARKDAADWLAACKNWCQQCQDQERSIKWLAWAVYVLSAWVILDVLCHIVRGRL